jgi:hypothetical protein
MKVYEDCITICRTFICVQLSNTDKAATVIDHIETSVPTSTYSCTRLSSIFASIMPSSLLQQRALKSAYKAIFLGQRATHQQRYYSDAKVSA